MTSEEIKQFSEILEELGKVLDVTESQYNAIVGSYKAVGDLLSKNGSLLSPYTPIIRPQGSFMLGTMTKPENEKQDLDIDLVCQLTGKNPSWTQYDLKQRVGDQIKSDATYKKMLDPEGRRCWTLVYSENANYHMDILPSIVDSGYSMVLERALSASDVSNLDGLAIRISDRFEPNYMITTNHQFWLKSNPFGYGKWFYETAKTDNVIKAFSLNESVKPVPTYQPNKFPLQRVVQILKRHRDIMFDGDDDKPISIIITTLAARAYKKERNVFDALNNVVRNMRNEIKEVYSPKHGKYIKQVLNPVNSQENFADKWTEKPRKQELFYKWLDQLELDVARVTQKRGLSQIQEAFYSPFGKNSVTKAFSNYADNFRTLRESGNLKMTGGTGFLGSIGTTLKNHNFDGDIDK